MKRLLAITGIIGVMAATFGILSFAPAPAAAYDPLDEACVQGRSASVCQNKSADNPLFGPSGAITKATQLLTIAVGAISVIMIIIGGFRYIVSGGDSNATKGAKDTILYAVIGLIIALIAQALVLFVLRRL